MTLLRRKSSSNDDEQKTTNKKKRSDTSSKSDGKTAGLKDWKAKYFKLKERNKALEAKYEALEDESHQMLIAMTKQKPAASMATRLAVVLELTDQMAAALNDDEAAVNHLHSLLVKQRMRMRELTHKQQGEQDHGEAGESQPVPASQSEAGGRSSGQEQQQGQEGSQDLVQSQQDQGQDG